LFFLALFYWSSAAAFSSNLEFYEDQAIHDLAQSEKKSLQTRVKSGPAMGSWYYVMGHNPHHKKRIRDVQEARIRSPQAAPENANLAGKMTLVDNNQNSFAHHPRVYPGGELLSQRLEKLRMKTSRQRPRNVGRRAVSGVRYPADDLEREDLLRGLEQSDGDQLRGLQVTS